MQLCLPLEVKRNGILCNVRVFVQGNNVMYIPTHILSLLCPKKVTCGVVVVATEYVNAFPYLPIDIYF